MRKGKGVAIVRLGCDAGEGCQYLINVIEKWVKYG